MSREDFIAVIDEQRFHLDSVEDSQYWRQIGNFNFLSANPLDEFAEIISPDEGHSNNMGIPLALMECSPNQAHYVYANASYVKCIHDLGYASMEDLEQTFNDRRGDQYLMLKKLVTDAIELGTRQTVEYINNDIYYRVSAQRLAKQGSRAMLAMRLATFDSEHEVDTAKEMLTYGNSLFSTYEIVVMFYPEKGISKRIYSANSIPAYGRANSLQMSLQGFAASHVSEIDRERYKLFFDFKTLGARIDASPKGFIQSSFRLKLNSNGAGEAMDSACDWYTARVSLVPSLGERAYIMTIQSLPANEIRKIEFLLRTHPEAFEPAEE